MAKNDGGPAFPTPWTNTGDANASAPNGEIVPPGHTVYVPGISLRDYFAAAALAGICGDGIPGSHHRPEETAREAYAYADAMLRERNKEES